MAKPFFSIIIVSFNTRPLTINCIKSVYKHLPKNSFEIIVIDNSSKDGSKDAIKKEFPNVKLIVNKRNIGFGGANNQGAKVAKGRYLIFLNSDTLLLQDIVSPLISWIEAHSGLSSLGCKLVNPDGSLQYSLGHFPNILRIIFWMLFIDDLPVVKRYFPAFHLEDPRWYADERKIDWGMGAFLVVEKNAFMNVGGFDEKMFMYGEEVELLLRLRKSGVNFAYLPHISIIHIGGSSSDQISSSFKTTSEFEGVLYMLKKHNSYLEYVIAKVVIKFGALIRLIIFGLILNNPPRRKSYVKALLEN
jgi:GT2 family glycosyltransferase